MLQGSDPSSFIQSMMSQNPNIKKIMETMQQSAMTPKQFFYNYAQQNGIDVNKFLNS